jgi:hypothetical protein
VNINVNVGSLGQGIYNGVVTVNGSSPDNGSQSVPVTLNVTQQAPCYYWLSQYYGNIGASGGQAPLTVYSNAGACVWTASSSAPEISFANGGTGAGSSAALTINVAANNGGARFETINIGNQVYTLTQAGAGCSFTLSQSSLSLPWAYYSYGYYYNGYYYGGYYYAPSTSVYVTASSSNCSWTSTNSSGFLTVSPASGTGSQYIAIQSSMNDGTNAPARQATITVAGQPLAVSQGSNSCSSTTLNPSSASVSSSGGPLAIAVGGTCGSGVSNLPSWIAVSQLTASSVALNIAPNSSTQARSAYIYIGYTYLYLNQSGVACNFSLGNNVSSFGPAGGNGSVTITANSSSCSWAAASDASFATLTSAASGAGSGTLTFSVGANSGNFARTGSLVVAGQILPIAQSGLVCSYDLQSYAATVSGLGGTGVASVLTGPSCAVSTQSNATWLHITSGAGLTGPGDVGFLADPNPAATPRQGSLTIQGKSFTVTQNPMTCSYTLSAPSASFPTAGGSSSLQITASATGCSPTIQSNASWLTLSSVNFAPATGAGTIAFAAQSNPTPSVRTAAISIDDASFPVTVAQSACSYALGSAGAILGPLGGTGFVPYTAAPAGCTPVTTADPNITLGTTAPDPVSGFDLNYLVASFQSSVNWVRSMQINISGNIFTVKQKSY